MVYWVAMICKHMRSHRTNEERDPVPRERSDTARSVQGRTHWAAHKCIRRGSESSKESYLSEQITEGRDEGRKQLSAERATYTKRPNVRSPGLLPWFFQFPRDSLFFPTEATLPKTPSFLPFSFCWSHSNVTSSRKPSLTVLARI